MLNERQPNIDRNDGDMMHKKEMALIKVVVSKWMFILHKAQIIRYREVSMSYYIPRQWQRQLHQAYFRRRMKYKQTMFWFRNYHEASAVIEKRQICKIWNFFIDQHLTKCFFNFWVKWYEVKYGLTRTEMQ